MERNNPTCARPMFQRPRFDKIRLAAHDSLDACSEEWGQHAADMHNLPLGLITPPLNKINKLIN